MSRPQSVLTCSFWRSSGSGRAVGGARKQRAIEPRQERRQLALVWRVDHQDAAALFRRKAAIVKVVAIHRDERPAQLLREAVVLHVGRAAQAIFLEDEQDVPLAACRA